MAHSQPEPNVTVSVLDRLTDLEPNVPADTQVSRLQSMRQLKAALKRDLEWLLNTRRTPEEAGTESQVHHSLFHYGLPDMSGISINSIQDQNRMLWMLESAVATFEPRIEGARVVMEPVSQGQRIMRFQIQGLLRVDPAPERVTFDTTLELTSGEYAVKGD